MSPIKVFAVLIGLVAAIVIVAEVARDDAPPVAPQRTASPADFSLTNSEAIARFKELDALRYRAYTERDVTLIPLYMTSDSPLRRVGYREIRQLINDRVLFRPTVDVKNLRVLSNTPRQIVVRQVVIEQPKFVSEAGKDVSSSQNKIHQTIDWTLRLEGTEWKIFQAKVVDSLVTPKGNH